MSKRLLFLEKLTADCSTDPFHWYALALEYKSGARLEDALRTFEELKKRAPQYVPQYLMAGGVLEALGRRDDAKSWYVEGIAAARKAGDGHALSALEGALAAAG